MLHWQKKSCEKVGVVTSRQNSKFTFIDRIIIRMKVGRAAAAVLTRPSGRPVVLGRSVGLQCIPSHPMTTVTSAVIIPSLVWQVSRGGDDPDLHGPARGPSPVPSRRTQMLIFTPACSSTTTMVRQPHTQSVVARQGLHNCIFGRNHW